MWAVSDLAGASGADDSAHWSDVVYIPCADGKHRPLPRTTEPGLEPLAHGLPPLVVRGSGEGVPIGEVDPDETAEARVMRLKGYGNAIVPELAAMFLRSLRDVLAEERVE
jgi:hypothetical protein